VLDVDVVEDDEDDESLLFGLSLELELLSLVVEELPVFAEVPESPPLFPFCA